MNCKTTGCYSPAVAGGENCDEHHWRKPERGAIAFKAIIGLAVVLNAGFFTVRQFPGLLLLVEPGVTYRNPALCSTGRAISGVKIKLQQETTAKEILAGSQLVKSENGLDLWQTPDGSYWIRSGPRELLPTLLAQQRRDIYGYRDWGVHPGDVVLDCGAHVGVFTRKALAAGAKLVIAIEPAPAAVECLRRNFAGDKRVIVYPKGVWDKEEVLTFYLDKNADAGDSFVQEHNNAGTEKIPVTTIDKIVEELHLPRIDFIKMDIKGATERALWGAQRTLRKDRPRMALSTEEVADNPEKIMKTALTIVPSYQHLCGPCLLDQKQVYLDTLLFKD